MPIVVIETRLILAKKMGKRLRKAPEGTASIKSFFAPIGGKKDDAEGSQSSGEDSDVILTDPDSDSDWEDNKKSKSKRKRLRKSASKKENPKASTKKDAKLSRKSSSSQPKPKEVEVVKIIDEETAAFLRSGIPSVTAKAKQLNDIKREEEEATKLFGYFPKFTHVPVDTHPVCVDSSAWAENLGLTVATSDDQPVLKEPTERVSEFPSLRTEESELEEICCDLSAFNGVKCNQSDDGLPWIEKFGVIEKCNLAVDEEAVERVEGWLRKWKRDIRDDNGKYRKILEKVKKKGNDSDFVTSDEDTEFQTTGLLLYGPTGTGKTATVVSLAKKMGFKIVEVNFSTARPGKEVLRRVEEATLSHRLEATQTCLLLFEDICLIEPKEDEGFGAAVAQLITSSRRPIVMTMTTNDPVSIGNDCDYLVPDSKIEKKGYLPVYFPYQLPSVIVQKVLLPIVSSQVAAEAQDDTRPLLQAVARHCKGDIRKSINQLQLILSPSSPISKFHRHLSPYIDLNFILQSEQTEQEVNLRSYRRIRTDDEPEEEVQKPKELKSKQQIQKELKQLEDVKDQLKFAVDFDRVNNIFDQRLSVERKCDEDFNTDRSQTIRSCFNDALKHVSAHVVAKQISTPDSGVEIEPDEPQRIEFASLLFESEKEIVKDRKVQVLNSHLEEYCGTVGDLMTCGHFNYENFAYFRTIVKSNKLKAQSAQKRNRRISYYFNRVSHVVLDQVYETFDFSSELKRAQCYQLS